MHQNARISSHGNFSSSTSYGSDQLSRRVSEKIEEGDIRGAIRLASTDETMAPFNPLTLAALQDKHPSRTPTSSNWLPKPISVDDVNSTTSLIADHADIVAAIRSFPNGSANGLDGLKPQYLKDLTNAYCGHVGEQLINCLTVFTNLTLSGEYRKLSGQHSVGQHC